MTKAELKAGMSPVLGRFLGALRVFDHELFDPSVATLLLGTHAPARDPQIAFRLADEVLRVWAAETLDLKGRDADARTLRGLAAIADQSRAKVAKDAIYALAPSDLTDARNAAYCVSGDAPGGVDAEMTGTYAAGAAKALADCYPDEEKRKVYDRAAELFGKLRNWPSPA